MTGFNENFCSKSINDLLNDKICFVVPSYQRGYRWSSTQISRLLVDIYEFGIEKENSNPLVGDYYCLQPIVVKKLQNEDVEKKLGENHPIDSDVNYYEIVDGQQRMITVFILLKYLFRVGEGNLYSIRFERDKDKTINESRCALLDKMTSSFDSETVDLNYADAYYFVKAFKSIKEWIEVYKTKTGKNNLSSFMETVICEKTQVIWYELESGSDCYNIFKNLNHGKIPLTDAELVKAMLLNKKNYASEGVNEEIVKQEQDRYSRLWDEVQKALSDEGMWSFVTGGGNIDLPTNIDFLIRLIVEQEQPEELDDSDYKYFSYFEDKLANETETVEKKKYVEEVFEKLKNAFRTLQDWYNNYLLHNYIGFLLTYGPRKDISDRIKTIIELKDKYETMTKSEFVDKELKKRIKKQFDHCLISEINYEDNTKDVEKLLMLFNIEELNEIHAKFNFRVDEDGWSIEHIKAQHSEIINKGDRKVYLENEKESLEKLRSSTGDKDLIGSINTILPQIESLLTSTDIDDSEFKRVAELIDFQIDKFDSLDMHRLGNLALLSKIDNSSLGNKPFYKKRERINSWQKDCSKNIPYSTKKSFLKMYSSQEYTLDFTRWRKNDFDDLFACQKELLKYYIGGC